ncbi:glycosyltransferase family 2 protein [Pseudomonas paracarnis]|uniref:glycosyltransferase family 2 protein n=1 Tax=Pseudomonas paracarnis TaxID=2750625 RepID=UPI00249AA1A2|nr:glycosyltransferase family 2 protein [Pseudomonas paracarnis]MDI3184643.1 glycosyltransferase family 2 protein [Pseudomonas paracarnis]
MKISLVVPVFNEEDAIPFFYKEVRTDNHLGMYEIELIFVDDGSSDRTCSIVEALTLSDPLVTLVRLSRNFGKEAALFAGLDYSTGDAVIPIDVDLQDPIAVIPRLIEKWQAGYDVVLAKRVDRQSDSFMKRVSAEMFYRLHNKISNPKIEENVGDFRLMSRRVVEEIKMLPERHLFMKGLLSWVGFDTAIVEYTRADRVAGTSKFNGWKLWNLALEGITSFSTIPLRMWTYLGMVVATFSLFYAIWMVADKLIWGNAVPGYPSIMTAILFLGGVQLIGIGVLGEYIGRIYIEAKRRPKYIVKQVSKGSSISND